MYQTPKTSYISGNCWQFWDHWWEFPCSVYRMAVFFSPKTISKPTMNLYSNLRSISERSVARSRVMDRSYFAHRVSPISPGCWTSGFIAEKLDGKTSAILLFPVNLIGWLINGLANSVKVLITGLLSRCCVGVLALIYPTCVRRAIPYYVAFCWGQSGWPSRSIYWHVTRWKLGCTGEPPRISAACCP